MKTGSGVAGIVVIALGLLAAASAVAGDTPKRGGILTYLIPTDSPPSFDGHREWTFATAHTAAPFYSLLVEVNPLRKRLAHQPQPFPRQQPRLGLARQIGGWVDLHQASRTPISSRSLPDSFGPRRWLRDT
jgi:hypothetical protein